MKAFIHLALAAILATEAAAYSSHRHLHRHLKARADAQVKTFTPSFSSKLGENDQTKTGIEETTVNGKDGLTPEVKLEKLEKLEELEDSTEGPAVKMKYIQLKENKGETKFEPVPAEIALDELKNGTKRLTGQTATTEVDGKTIQIDLDALNEGKVKSEDLNTAKVKNPNPDTSRKQMLPPIAANLIQKDPVQNIANHNAPDATKNSIEKTTSAEEKIRKPNNQDGSIKPKLPAPVPQGTENGVPPVQDDNSRVQKKTSHEEKKEKKTPHEEKKTPHKEKKTPHAHVQKETHKDASAPIGNSMQADTFAQESNSKVKTVTHKDPITQEVKTYKFTFGPSPQFEGNLKSSREELEKPFPDGKLPCSKFPTGYGAHPLTWLQKNGKSPQGFSSVQKVDTAGWTWPESEDKEYHVATGDGSCQQNSFCAYACPPGYERTQWPKQPKSGQSVGGLYCDAKGKLRITRPEVKTLCKATDQNIVLVNEMKNLGITLCCTVYPGNEAMHIPIVAGPGQTVVVTNPPNWEFEILDKVTNKTKTTSKHCYLQPAGVSMSDGCNWRSTREPMISADLSVLTIGTSINKAGDTYFSMSQNLPKSPSKFITDVHVDLLIQDQEKPFCSYEGRKTWRETDLVKGCTAHVSKGKKGIIRVRGPFPIKGNPEVNDWYFKP